jgi:hypothetical protein
VKRRAGIEKVRFFFRILVNNIYVARTNKKFLSKDFEINISEQVQIKMFTMPSSIKLELVTGNFRPYTLVDRIEMEVPGKYVKALTSASSLIREVAFSKNEFKKKPEKLVPKKPDENDNLAAAPPSGGAQDPNAP